MESKILFTEHNLRDRAASCIMAAVLANVSRGGKLILGRNSQASVFNAMRIGGILPVYISPEIDETYGLQAGISSYDVRAVCEAYPEAEAVLITSPNCYGYVSDIREIAAIAHDFGMVLIVDQSYGSHFALFDAAEDIERSEGEYMPLMRKAAENLGADIVISSVNENLVELTGNRFFNICTDNTDEDLQKDWVGMLQPEVPLTALIGRPGFNDKLMYEWGFEAIRNWKSNLQFFHKYASRIPGVTAVAPMTAAERGLFEASAYDYPMDLTRLTISMSEFGVSGYQLAKDLRYQGIAVEAVHGDYVVLVTGADNRKSDYTALLDALKSVSDNYAVGSHDIHESVGGLSFVMGVSEVPLEKESVPLYRADGRVLYDPIVAYPPGSPIACPGEIMNIDVITYISRAMSNEDSIVGVDDEGCIFVGRE